MVKSSQKVIPKKVIPIRRKREKLNLSDGDTVSFKFSWDKPSSNLRFPVILWEGGLLGYVRFVIFKRSSYSNQHIMSVEDLRLVRVCRMVLTEKAINPIFDPSYGTTVFNLAMKRIGKISKIK